MILPLTPPQAVLKRTTQLLLSLGFLLLPQTAALAEIYQVRLFFGLSRPDGGGVSLQEWQEFQEEELAATFEGFNVVDSTGYYLGDPERSKLVTLIVEEEQLGLVKELAQSYAEQFDQDSVMMVQTPVEEWLFIGPESELEIKPE
jgi:hypothetical protein